MEFVETDIFTKRIEEMISDIEYGFLQAYLTKKPDAGDLVPGGKGLRKLRWTCRGKGKSGGMRVIYYLYLRQEQIFMIYPYKKSDQEDLTPEQLKILARHVKGGVL